MAWSTGLIVNAILCALIATICSMIKNNLIKTSIYIAMPGIISLVLYWGLAYLKNGGTPSSEYSSWVGIFVGPWAMSGYTSVLCVILFMNKSNS
jgi:hypothetical protein